MVIAVEYIFCTHHHSAPPRNHRDYQVSKYQRYISFGGILATPLVSSTRYAIYGHHDRHNCVTIATAGRAVAIDILYIAYIDDIQ